MEILEEPVMKRSQAPQLEAVRCNPKEEFMDEVITWLLTASPLIEYRTRLDLLHENRESFEVRNAKQAMISDPLLEKLIQDLLQWPGEVLKSHKSAGHPIHKLTLIADLGFDISDSHIARIVELIQQHQEPDGPYQVVMNIHPRYGGSGMDEWSWALCDAPLLVYALAKFGLCNDPGVINTVSSLAELVRENGWPCTVSKELGKFRGPGRKEDPCPYATLVMLKALTQFHDMIDSDASRLGVESILTLWEERRERHPYIFYMGNDFSKLKAPLIWYDILHAVEVLSHFPWVLNDGRFVEMVEIVEKKADAEGLFTPESIWTAWKEWDFGQKKVPSAWLTFLIYRLQVRIHGIPISDYA